MIVAAINTTETGITTARIITLVLSSTTTVDPPPLIVVDVTTPDKTGIFAMF